MGPFLLVDKSFIQSLSKEEIDFLDRHYMVLLSPILIQEIGANLKKYPDDPSLSKKKVSLLAKKAKGFDARSIDRYELLCHADLLGAGIPLIPQIPRFNGKMIFTEDGTKGVVYEESFEINLLRQWAEMNFSEKDIKIAEEHVNTIRDYDLEKSRQVMAKIYPENTRFRSFDELISWIDHANSSISDQGMLIEAKLRVLRLPKPEQVKIMSRWEKKGKPPFRAFAPYAYYCYRLNSIFWIGITSGLIPTSKKAKVIIDYQYLFYLPFSHAFCSGDNFHRTFSEYFLRCDQEFIWGQDLRSDLHNIFLCYLNMTADEKLYYEKEFGSYPPPMQESITVDLWRKHMRPWTPGSGNLAIDMTNEEKKRLSKRINQIIDVYESKQ